MYFVPLNQVESVDLVIHALRAAAGEADCTVCPVRKVCMKQCLAIAEAIETMASEGTLPQIDDQPSGPDDGPGSEGSPAGGGGGFLKVVK